MAAPWAMIIKGIQDRLSEAGQAKKSGDTKGVFNALLNPLPTGARGSFGKQDKGFPALEDPEERALASYVTRRKRAFRTGTAQASQRSALLSAMKTGQERAIKIGGGAKGLNTLTQLFNQSQLGLGQTALAGESEFGAQEVALKQRLSQKKLELNLLKYNTLQARQEQSKKEGKANTGQALSRIIGTGQTNPYGTAGKEVEPLGTAPKTTIGLENE